MRQILAAARRRAWRNRIAACAVPILCAVTLNACVSMYTRRASSSEWQALKQASKTVVYIEPKPAMGMTHISNAGLVAGKGAAVALIAGIFASPGFVIMSPFTSPLEQYENYVDHIKTYLPVISGLKLSQRGLEMAHRATAAVPWLDGAPLKTAPASEDLLYLQNIALQNPTSVTFFIIPQGSELSSDAKEISITYGVSTYIRTPHGAKPIRLLETATIETEQDIPFPEDIEDYDPLTSPSTNALADRINMLFADNGAYFMRYFTLAMQAEQDKITSYLAQHDSWKW